MNEQDKEMVDDREIPSPSAQAPVGNAEPEVVKAPAPRAVAVRTPHEAALDAHEALVKALDALNDSPEAFSARRRAKELHQSLVLYRG
jgi:hypothetical protein